MGGPMIQLRLVLSLGYRSKDIDFTQAIMTQHGDKTLGTLMMVYKRGDERWTERTGSFHVWEPKHNYLHDVHFPIVGAAPVSKKRSMLTIWSKRPLTKGE